MDYSLDELIGRGVTQTSRNILRTLTDSLKEYGITPEQWTVIKKLARQDGISQKALSLSADKDQATLTRILHLIEKKGLIERRNNINDRRSYLIHLTEQGRMMEQAVYPIVESLYAQTILRGISEEELQLFLGVLKKISHNAE